MTVLSGISGTQKRRRPVVTPYDNALPDCFHNSIVCGDFLDVAKTIPDASVDLVVTSPPYNIKNSTGNGLKDGRGGKWSRAGLIRGYANYHDSMPHDEYAEWQRACLTEMLRVLRNDGAIFYNHKWRVQGGLLQDRQVKS